MTTTTSTMSSTSTFISGVNSNGNVVYITGPTKRRKNEKKFSVLDDTQLINRGGKIFQTRLYKDIKNILYKLEIESNDDPFLSKVELSISDLNQFQWLSIKTGQPFLDYGIQTNTQGFIAKKVFQKIIKDYEKLINKLIENKDENVSN